MKRLAMAAVLAGAFASLATGRPASNGGDPSGTEFPARFEVDYVRVYAAAQQ